MFQLFALVSSVWRSFLWLLVSLICCHTRSKVKFYSFMSLFWFQNWRRGVKNMNFWICGWRHKMVHSVSEYLQQCTKNVFLVAEGSFYPFEIYKLRFAFWHLGCNKWLPLSLCCNPGSLWTLQKALKYVYGACQVSP